MTIEIIAAFTATVLMSVTLTRALPVAVALVSTKASRVAVRVVLGGCCGVE